MHNATMYETNRRAHIFRTNKKKNINWKGCFPEENEMDPVEPGWFHSSLCPSITTCVLVEEVVEEAAKDEKSKANINSLKDRAKDKKNTGQRKEDNKKAMTGNAHPDGFVRALELSTEGFWEFLFSDRWEDTCLLRVICGELLDNLLAAMYLLERDHDVISYVTIAHSENVYDKPLTNLKTKDRKMETETIVEKIFVELEYFCLQSRPAQDKDGLPLSQLTENLSGLCPLQEVSTEKVQCVTDLIPSSPENETLSSSEGSFARPKIRSFQSVSRKDTGASRTTLSDVTQTTGSLRSHSFASAKRATQSTFANIGARQDGPLVATANGVIEGSTASRRSTRSTEYLWSEGRQRAAKLYTSTPVTAQRSTLRLPKICSKTSDLSIVQGAGSLYTTSSDPDTDKEGPLSKATSVSVKPQSRSLPAVFDSAPGFAELGTTWVCALPHVVGHTGYLCRSAIHVGSGSREATNVVVASRNLFRSRQRGSLARRVSGGSYADSSCLLPDIQVGCRHIVLPPIQKETGSSITTEQPTVTHLPQIKCNIRGMTRPPPHKDCRKPFHMMRESFMARRNREGHLFQHPTLPSIGLTLTSETDESDIENQDLLHNILEEFSDDNDYEMVAEDPFLQLCTGDSATPMHHLDSARSSPESSTHKRYSRGSSVSFDRYTGEQMKSASSVLFKRKSSQLRTGLEASASTHGDRSSSQQNLGMRRASNPKGRYLSESVPPLSSAKIKESQEKLPDDDSRKSEKTPSSKVASLKNKTLKGQSTGDDDDDRDYVGESKLDATRAERLRDDIKVMTDELLARKGTGEKIVLSFPLPLSKPFLVKKIGGSPLDDSRLTLNKSKGRSKQTKRAAAIKGHEITEMRSRESWDDVTDAKCARIMKWPVCPTFTEFYRHLGNLEGLMFDDAETPKKSKSGHVIGKGRQSPNQSRQCKLAENMSKTQDKEKWTPEVKKPEQKRSRTDQIHRKPPSMKPHMQTATTWYNTPSNLSNIFDTERADGRTEKSRMLKGEGMKVSVNDPILKKAGMTVRVKNQMMKKAGMKESDNDQMLNKAKMKVGVNDRMLKKAGMKVGVDFQWHTSVRFAYLAGGVCDSIWVRNALLRQCKFSAMSAGGPKDSVYTRDMLVGKKRQDEGLEAQGRRPGMPRSKKEPEAKKKPKKTTEATEKETIKEKTTEATEKETIKEKEVESDCSVYNDIFDIRKLKNSHSFEEIFIPRQEEIGMSTYNRLLKKYKAPLLGRRPTHIWLPQKEEETAQKQEEKEMDSTPPPQPTPFVLGKLREFPFLKYRDYVSGRLQLSPPPEVRKGRFLTVEETCDRLLKAMQTFVVRKERATTTNLFKSKVSVTFTRRQRMDGGCPLMADSRRVVAGVCHTLTWMPDEQGRVLVPC